MGEGQRQLGRRGVLLGGAGILLAACSTDRHPATRPTPSPTPSPNPTVTPSHRPPSARDWDRLSRHVRGDLRRPGDSGYDQVRLVENPRYDDNDPLAVLSVASAADVATAFAFAQDHDLPVAVRSGGHSYPGWSAGGAPHTGVPRSLVIDCRPLDRVEPHGDGTATVGAGASLAAVYQAIGSHGRALAGGSCPTVGISGLTLGGGVGVLTRALGLTCDAVRSMQVVTADGRHRHVDADHDPDLFWALRGGGGGHLGVVTAMTFRTVAAPSLQTFYLSWPFDRASEVIQAWQDWAPHADRRLWSTCKALGGAKHPAGPSVLVAGTWTGPGGALPGQLAGLLDHCPAPSVNSTHAKGYLEAMMSYAGCADVPASRCHTGPGGDLQREAFAATSHVGYDALDSPAVGTLLDHVDRAQGSGLTEAGISMDALGGRVRDLGPRDTAFWHRRALMTVQYTATFTGPRASRATEFVRGFRRAMLPAWGNHAYVNYADQAVQHYASAYFGGNAGRLAQVRERYDPEHFFTQPQDF